MAVNLPAQERRSIHRATAPLRELGAPVKWTGEDSLHVTLRFLGEVAEDRARAIGEALAGAVRKVRPFDVTLGGVGAFPDLDDPRVLWIGVERHPALELLANDVEMTLQGFGFEPELRPFQPHLTIGRARKDAGRKKLGVLDGPAREINYSGVLVVDAIDLMVSKTGKGGAVYRSLRRATLDGN